MPTIMLRVKNTIRSSPIHGIGLFAAEDIPKDTVIWQFDPRMDQILNPSVFPSLPEAAQSLLVRHAYRSKRTGNYILDFDNGRFFNHSDTPNTYTKVVDGVPEDVIFSNCDIKEGQELTLDYSLQEDELGEENAIVAMGEKLGIEDDIDPRIKQ